MNRNAVNCPTCKRDLNAELYNTAVPFELCAACHGKVTVRAYPALYRQAEGLVSTLPAKLDDAVCYYHTDKKAHQVCDACGRFLCALCELPLGGETLCTTCLELRRKEPGRHLLKPRQIRYDKLAIQLAVWPLLYFPLTFFSGPATLFVVLRYWKKDLELSPRRKVRMVLAFLIGLLETIGWTLLVILIIGKTAYGR